jgi:hypothetical protein
MVRPWRVDGSIPGSSSKPRDGRAKTRPAARKKSVYPASRWIGMPRAMAGRFRWMTQGAYVLLADIAVDHTSKGQQCMLVMQQLKVTISGTAKPRNPQGSHGLIGTTCTSSKFLGATNPLRRTRVCEQITPCKMSNAHDINLQLSSGRHSS